MVQQVQQAPRIDSTAPAQRKASLHPRRHDIPFEFP
jgi:hypothetical protein